MTQPNPLPELATSARPGQIIRTRYECIVYGANQSAFMGKPVAVFAATAQAAVERAIAIGWIGSATDARVLIKSVEDIPSGPARPGS